jgi:nitronate monooxygenase
MKALSPTSVTRLLRIPHPIVQGPMGGGSSTPELVAAVSNAGGLGSLGAYQLQPEEIGLAIQDIRRRTDRPFALNLWVPRDQPLPRPAELEAERLAAARGVALPFRRELGLAEAWELPDTPLPDFERQVSALLDAAPPVFSFVFGIPPAAVLESARERGIVTIGTATTVDEAEALDAAGVDLICASGFEAGGHRGAFLRSATESLVGTMALVPQVVSAVARPVIAAGGIADGRGVAAALALGAGAAQLGTAFLATAQSGASPLHREALFDPARTRQTMITRGASGRHARLIRNRYLEALDRHEPQLLPFPLQGALMREVQRAALSAARPELLALYAGQAAPLHTHRDAAGLVDALVSEAASVLNALAGR